MSDGDLSNLVRRLRRFGERWPEEEPTAEMCREAADELERLVAETGRVTRERDAYAGLLVVPAVEPFEGKWYVTVAGLRNGPDLPIFADTRELAMAAVRVAAGLEGEDTP